MVYLQWGNLAASPQLNDQIVTKFENLAMSPDVIH